MRWLEVFVMFVMCGVAVPVRLECTKPDCSDGAGHRHPEWGYSYSFMVDGNRIEIYYKTHEDSHMVSLNCHGYYALDADLPRFHPTLHVNTVVLEACPPPQIHQKFSKVLEVMNVKLETISPYKGTHLSLKKVPSYPTLDANHFAGLEYLTNLTIDNGVKLDLNPSAFFLWPLMNLTKLQLKRVNHPFRNTPGIITETTDGTQVTHEVNLNLLNLTRILYRNSGLMPQLRVARSQPAQESTARSRYQRELRIYRKHNSQPTLIDRLENEVTKLLVILGVKHETAREEDNKRKKIK